MNYMNKYSSIETLLDPFNETISVVPAETGAGRWQGYREIIEASMFGFVRLYSNGDGVYIDDEGLYSEKQYFWMHRNYPQPLVNKACFVGMDEEGETIPPKTSLTQFEKDVVFIGSRYQLVLNLQVHSDKVIKDKEGYDVDYRPIFFNMEE